MLLRFTFVCLAMLFTLLSGVVFIMWRLYSDGIYQSQSQIRWWHFIPSFVYATLLWTAAMSKEDG